EQKSRDGGTGAPHYDTAQNHLCRLLDKEVLASEKNIRLINIFTYLYPILLLEQTKMMQDALWQMLFMRKPKQKSLLLSSMVRLLVRQLPGYGMIYFMRNMQGIVVDNKGL
ncbi:MAG: hypothetical protein WBB23_21210, partial [Desulforhopalus sp.]